MKRINTFSTALTLLLFAGFTASAQIKLSDIFKKVTEKQSATTSATGTPSTFEIGQGIKEALQIGISAGATGFRLRMVS